jgi:hypothetical protein
MTKERPTYTQEQNVPLREVFAIPPLWSLASVIVLAQKTFIKPILRSLIANWKLLLEPIPPANGLMMITPYTLGGVGG